MLVARGLVPSAAERDRILAATNDTTLARWLQLVATCTSVRELLAANGA